MSSYVCPECGLDYDTISAADGIVAIRTFPRRYRSALAAALEDESDAGLIRRRPEPEVWSALEYTAHVVDVLGGTATWIGEVRTKDNPTLTMPEGGLFGDVEAGGGTPEGVLGALEGAATDLVAELEKVDAMEWHRSGTFPWGERDLLITMRNAVHEGSHHLRDVEQVLDRARGRG